MVWVFSFEKQQLVFGVSLWLLVAYVKYIVFEFRKVEIQKMIMGFLEM